MSGIDHYSFTRVKRSLGFFAVGKVGSGLVGLVLLVILARILPRTEYGIYMTYMALFEIVQLISNFGLYPIAQRYVTDCRIRGTQRQLTKMVAWSCLGRFFTLAIACGVLYVLSERLLDFMGMLEAKPSFIIYLMVMLTEGVSRYIDVIFESLLLQGFTQACIFFRNFIKLGAFSGMAWFGGGLNLDTLVKLEAMTTAGGLGLALILITIYFMKSREKQQVRTSVGGYAASGMVFFSLQYYLAQVLGQLYGGDAIKLITTRILGVMEAASFGFAYSITMVMQRYLPTYLLLGMVRPLFVAKFGDGSDLSNINRMANLMFKLNMFCIAPVIAYFLLYGTEFSSLVSGGKYPEAGRLMAILCILLILQSLHIILGLLSIASGNSSSNLGGTMGGIVGVVVGVFLARLYGIYGLVSGLILSEFLWCALAWFILSRSGYGLRLDWKAVFKLSFVATCVVALLDKIPSHANNVIDLSLLMSMVLFSYILLAYLIQPFSKHERETINRFLPKPMFVW